MVRVSTGLARPRGRAEEVNKMNLNRLVPRIAAVAVAAVGCVAGFKAACDSWNGTVIVRQDYGGNRRGPAAIRRVFDFSRLEGGALRLASQRRLVSDARVILADANVGVELGHFVTRGADGSRLFACEYFDRLEIQFEGEGVAESGEKATMKVDAPCLMGQDLNRISPIWIPVARILSQKPADMDLSFADNVKFRFENIPSSWPKTWIMTSVTIFNSQEGGREITISREEMVDIAERPLRMTW